MTIPSLLRHAGINVRRYVTVDGKIVFDDPKASPMRNVTPLAPHRFHGGKDPAPSRIEYEDAWWNTDVEAREADMHAMQAAFPHFEVYTNDGNFWYSGVIDSGRGRFPLILLPQVNGSLPTAATPVHRTLGRNEGRYWRKSPHLYTSGALCVAGVNDWHAGEHTTATVGAWAAHWFAAYSVWRVSGTWPTDGYGLVV